MIILDRRYKNSLLLVKPCKSYNLLDSNKSINFNKKSHFKTFVYVSYDTYDFTIQYDSYYTYTISYDLYDTQIRYRTFYTRYDMYCVSYNPYRVFYNFDNYGYIGVTDLEIFFLFLFLQTNSSENQ